MSFRVAAILTAAVGQHAQQLDIVLLKERYNPVIEQIRCRDRRLAIVQLGASNLRIGIDEGLLVDTADALEIADIECVLGTAIARMLALELAVRLLLDLPPCLLPLNAALGDKLSRKALPPI